MKPALALLLLVSAAAAQPKKKSPPVPVTVAAVGTHVFRDTVSALGTVRAREAVALTAPVTGRVIAVHFEDGQAVEAGTLLVELDTARVEARKKEIQARLAQHEKEWRRVRRLARADMATASERDAQKALMDTARAELGTLAAELADHAIKAPFTGVLGLRQVSPGSLVAPGTRVATLDAIDTINVDFPVPALHLAALKAGLPITAQAAAWPEPFTGEVVAVENRVDPVTRSVTVRARIPNPAGKLRPGLLLTVRLETGSTTALSVPEGALTPQGTRHRVYVVEDGKAALKEVEIGRRAPGKVEIVAGLSPDATVVVDGIHRVRPGAVLKVVEAPAKADDAAAPSKPASDAQ